jgi:hypothetical protein
MPISVKKNFIPYQVRRQQTALEYLILQHSPDRTFGIKQYIISRIHNILNGDMSYRVDQSIASSYPRSINLKKFELTSFS